MLGVHVNAIIHIPDVERTPLFKRLAIGLLSSGLVCLLLQVNPQGNLKVNDSYPTEKVLLFVEFNHNYGDFDSQTH